MQLYTAILSIRVKYSLEILHLFGAVLELTALFVGSEPSIVVVFSSYFSFYRPEITVL